MTTKIENLVPAVIVHPGEILKDELDDRGIRQKEFAELIGIQPTQLNELLNGKRNINADLALIIGKALNMDPKIWMNLQTNYELDLAKANKKNEARVAAIDQWQMIQKYIAEKFLKKQGYIKGDPLIDIEIIRGIYGFNHFEELASSFSQASLMRLRKSEKSEVDNINLLAWIKVVNYEAKNIIVSKFDSANRKEIVEALKDIIWKNKNTIVRVKDTLKDYGIKFIVKDNPEKCAIDGFAFWNEGNPSIGLTLRHKRIDNLAFTLFHELGHIFSHLVNDNRAEFVDIEVDIGTHNVVKEELEADAFAMNNLIDPQTWRVYMESETKMQEKSMIGLARKEQIHPAIIKGRLCFELNNYKIKTRFDSKIN